MTWRVVHADLRAGTPQIEPGTAPAYAVFWWGSLPLGTGAFLPEELPLGRDRLLALAAQFVAQQLAARLPRLGGLPRASGDGRPLVRTSLEAVRDFSDIAAIDALAMPAEARADDMSVIVCTRDRPPELAACLRALAAQRCPPGEILVIDNSVARSAESSCAAFPQVRYVHEPRPGLSAARNAGIAHSTRALLAFTDDDVEVHSDWTAELVRAFDNAPDADSVTGLVVPASLETEAQRFFQFEMGGFGACYVPMRFEQRFFAESLPHGPQVWRIGAGANMAFRRAVFERIGGFDERLGAGAAGCSEDSELWYRILAAGGTCMYEPRAVVFHHHRADWAGFRRQMRAYMRGHVAALVVQNDRHGHAGNLRRIGGQLPSYFVKAAMTALRNGSGDRGRVLLDEVRGWMAGLLFLLRPGWRRSDIARAPAPIAAPR